VSNLPHVLRGGGFAWLGEILQIPPMTMMPS